MIEINGDGTVPPWSLREMREEVEQHGWVPESIVWVGSLLKTIEARNASIAELVANRDRWHRRAMIERRKVEVYRQALNAARHRAAVAVVDKHDLDPTLLVNKPAMVQGPADADVYFDPDGIEVGS